MGLSIKPNRVMKRIATLIAVMALVAQPMYGFVSVQVANAIATGTVSAVDASYIKDAGYTGIYIGFDVENVSTAKKVELRVNRTNGAQPYSVFAKELVVTKINTESIAAKYSTGGTAIVTGSRTSSSWTPQEGTWTGTSKPVSVDVIVTLDDNTELKSSDSSIRDNGATLDQVMPVPPADTAVPVVTTINQAYEEKENGRIAVTLTFNEAINVNSLGQGWSEVTGSNKTQFIKRYYVTKEYTVTFKDLANNLGTYTFTVDKTAPTVVQSEQAYENHTNGPRTNVTLTFSEAINPTSLPQGWYEVTGSNKTKFVKAFYSSKTHLINFADLVGNSGMYSLTVDATAPLSPVLSLKTAQGTVLASGEYTNKSDVVASWTKPDGDIAKYEYAYWNNIPGSQYNAENKAWTTDVSDVTRSGAFDQGEGKHYMKVRAFDPAGNPSAWSNVFEVTYDKTLPTNFAIKLADGRAAQGTTVGGEQAFIFTQDEANPKSIYIEYMEKDTNGNWAKKQGKEILESNTAQLTVDTTAWNDGAHQIKVTTKDNAGHSTSTTAQFIVDNTDPTATIKTGTQFTVGSNGTYQKVSYALYDAHNIDKVVINGVTKDLSNNNYSDVNFITKGVFGAVEGQNKMVVFDVAGNSKEYTFTIDTEAPQPPIHALPANNIAQKSNDFWFDWNDVSDAVSYELQNSQTESTGSDGSFTNVQWTGDYQKNQPTESKARSVGANGTWYWQVRAVDAAGNKSSWSTPWKVTIDQQAPVATSASITGPVKSLDQKVVLSLTLQDESTNIVSAKYTLYNDTTDEAIEKNMPIAGTYTSKTANLLADIDVSTLPTGLYRVQLHFNDAAGNQGKRTVSFAVNNNIVVEVTSVEEGTPTPTITGTARWVVDETPLSNTDVTVTVGEQPYETQTNAEGEWTVTVNPALNVGTYAVVVSSLNRELTMSTPAQVVITPAPTTVVPGVSNPEGINSIPQGSQNVTRTSPLTAVAAPQRLAVATPVLTVADDSDASTNLAPVATDSAVLGAETKSANNLVDKAAVAGVSTEKANMFSYWWILAAIAAIGAFWWIIAAIRRKRAEQEA